MAVTIDIFPDQAPSAYTVSYVADKSSQAALIVPKGVTVTYKGKTYDEGTWIVQRANGINTH